MPTVPTYQDTQAHVALRPEYSEGFTVKADAEAFGSAIGKGMQGLATGMGALGEAIVQVEQLDNANAAKDSLTKFEDWKREASYGKGGYLTLTGRAAVEGRAAFEKLAEQKRAEFGKGLSPGAARTYEETSRASMNSLLDVTIRHQADQRKAWFAETSQRSIQSASDDAVAVYNDPARVDAAIGKGVAGIEHQGRMQGWSPQELDRQRTQYISDTQKKVALRMAEDSAIKAEEYARTAPGLLPAARTDILKTLQTAVTDEKARQNATDIIAGLPPTYTGAPDANGAPSPAAVDAGTGERQPAVDPARPTVAAGNGPQTDGSGSRTGAARTLGAQPSAGRTEALQTAGNRTAAPQTAGPQAAGPQMSAAPRTPPRQPSGPEDFRTVAAALAFPGKAKDDLALAAFVKNAAGTTVDPSLRPWLADVTGSLLTADAASLRHFGLPTQTPRPGDIVVLGPQQRKGAGSGSNDKGQIGLFGGYDADGNVLVRVPDPRRAGDMALTARPANEVVAFRTPGTVDEKTTTLPNYNPESLRRIEESLNGITNPALRAATEQQLSGYMISQKKAIDAQRQQVQEWANNQVIADPAFDPTKLPVHIQQAIGPAGLLALRDYKEKVRAYGQPVTDLQTLYDLQTEFATDPAAFAQIDLLPYRSRLSDKDWERASGWRQTALTDLRKARLESLDINTAFELARPQLEALGFFKDDSGFLTANSVPTRVALFRTTLLDQMDAFKEKNNGQNPTQSDIQKMINRLLLPIVITSPNPAYGGWDPGKSRGYLYQANRLADDESYDIAVDYQDIPRDLRLAIEADLTKKNGRKPSQDEIAREYELFMLDR